MCRTPGWMPSAWLDAAAGPRCRRRLSMSPARSGVADLAGGLRATRLSRKAANP